MLRKLFLLTSFLGLVFLSGCFASCDNTKSTSSDTEQAQDDSQGAGMEEAPQNDTFDAEEQAPATDDMDAGEDNTGNENVESTEDNE